MTAHLKGWEDKGTQSRARCPPGGQAMRENAPARFWGQQRGRQQADGHPVWGAWGGFGSTPHEKWVLGSRGAGQGVEQHPWGQPSPLVLRLPGLGARGATAASEGEVSIASIFNFKKKKNPTPTRRSPRTDGGSAGGFAEVYFLLIRQYVISNADDHPCAGEGSAFGGSQNRRR